MAGAEFIEPVLTAPADAVHAPCGLRLDSHAEVVEHEQSCLACRAWLAIRGWTWHEP